VRIGAEAGTQGLAQRNRLGGNGVHERPALQAGENRRIDLLGDFRIVHQDHAAARATQGFVRGRGHHMGIWQRRGMRSAGDQPGDMGHVHHQPGADRVGDLAEPLPVPQPRIGRATGKDQLGLVLMG
jgi:hypothetical protein